MKNHSSLLKKNFSKHQMKSQRGVAIVMVIGLLIVMTLIGLSGLETSLQNEQVGYNQRERDVGFQAAETSLRDGEHWVQSTLSKPTAVSSCGTPPCLVWTRDALSFVNQTDSWWASQSRVFSGNLSKVSAQPTFVIEELMFVPYELSPDAASRGQGYYYYRVTSRGTGAQGSTIVILESVYGTQYN